MNEVFDPIRNGINWPEKGDVQPFVCTDSYTEVKLKGVIPGTCKAETPVLWASTEK